MTETVIVILVVIAAAGALLWQTLRGVRSGDIGCCGKSGSGCGGCPSATDRCGDAPTEPRRPR